MPFDLQNDYFQDTLNGGDGNTYTLTFVPAHHQDATSPNAESFLREQIFPSVKAKVSYPENVPFGLPTAHSLELKINLANFSGDYGDVATQIVKGRSASQRTINGRGMYVPNLWVLECTAISFSKIYAQLPSEKDIDISKGKAEYTINLIGIEKAVFERLTITDLDLESVTPDYTVSTSIGIGNIVYDIGFSDDGGTNYRYIGEEPNNQMKLYKNSTIFTNIESKAQNVYDGFSRGVLNATTVDLSISDIDNVWTFYEQDITTNHSKSVSTVGFSDLMLIGGVLNGSGDYNDGFFDVSKNGFYTYNNVWSFLRQFCTSFLLKAKWGTGASTGLTLNFYPALETISSAEDIGALDPKDFKLAPDKNYVSEATAFVLGTGQYDYKDFKAVSEYGSLDGVSQDAEIMFNTYNMKFFDALQEILISGSGLLDSDNEKFIKTPSELRKRQNTNIRTYYYYKSLGGRFYWKVHEDCTLDIGGGNAVIAGDTSYTAVTYPDWSGSGNRALINAEWWPNVAQAIIERQPFYGVAYNRTQGVKAMLGNTNQGVLKGTLGYQIDSSTNLDLSKLGEAFTINLGAVSEVPSLGEFSGDIILTSIDYDLIGGDIDCEFFMRADAGA